MSIKSPLRDLTRAQFDARLDREGFVRDILGCYFRDTRETNGRTSYGAIIDPTTFKIRHRETLVKLLAERRAREAMHRAGVEAQR